MFLRRYFVHTWRAERARRGAILACLTTLLLAPLRWSERLPIDPDDEVW